MIDRDKFYWACRRYGLYKLANVLEITPAGMSKKMKNPTDKFWVGEYLTICRLLHPDLSDAIAVNEYLT